jgi:hypothetical protein
MPSERANSIHNGASSLAMRRASLCVVGFLAMPKRSRNWSPRGVSANSTANSTARSTMRARIGSGVFAGATRKLSGSGLATWHQP